jgi:hypothetical protein
MADGSFKPIADIQNNDLVRSGVRAENVAAVNAKYAFSASRLCEIRWDAGAASSPNSVLATEDHPFWVDGRGWTPARDLAAGDWLFNAQGGRVRVLSNQPVNRGTTVYSLSLSGDTAFYANGVLVHDSCGAPPPATALKAMEVLK